MNGSGSPAEPDGIADERAVVRNFLTLGGGEMVSRVIGFVGTIWIARQLGVEAYGVVGFAFAALLYFGAIGDLGMEQLGPREVAGAGPSLDTLASSMMIARAAASGIIALLLAPIGLLLLAPPDGVVLALYGLTLLPLGASARWVHVGLENARTVAASRLLAEAVRVSLLLGFVHAPEHLYRVPLAHFAGEALAAALLLGALRRRGVRVRPALDFGLVRRVLRRAFPLLVTNLLALVIYNADIVILRAFRDAAEVGLYLAAYTLINFLGVLGNTATLSILPSLSRRPASAEPARALYHGSLVQVAAVGLPVAAGGALLAPAVIALVFGPLYAESAATLQVLLMSIPLLLLRSVTQAALIASGRQDRVLQVTGWAAAVTLGMNLALVPLLGKLGAAVTTVVAELTRWLIAQRYAAAEGYGGARAARYGRPVAATAAMAVAVLALRSAPLWTSVPAGAAAYVAVLAALGGIRREGRSIRLTL